MGRGAHIVVGTPGRLGRSYRTRRARPGRVADAVVLDEADEMLDLGFREDLEHILHAAPEQRRTLLFSATVSPDDRAARRPIIQRDAVRVSTLGGAHPAQRHSLSGDVGPRQADRENAVINLLRYHEEKKALVFCSTRATVHHLSARLGQPGLRGGDAVGRVEPDGSADTPCRAMR